MHVVRLLAPQLDNENHTKDVDFSPGSIRMRWEAGYEKTMRALEQAPWEQAFDPARRRDPARARARIARGRIAMSQAAPTIALPHAAGSIPVLRRTLIIGLTAFLTVVDLFATQAILPSLARAYQVTPAAMGLAVNASTFGMAVAGLTVALFDRHLDRRLGILVSLVLLAIPTALLANAPDLTVFAALRVAQGPVHGIGIHADARLSRRRVQRDGRRRRVRRLHHRQCREQSDRPADSAASPTISGSRPISISSRRSTSPAPSWSISPSTHRADAAMAAPRAPRWLRICATPLRAAFGIGFCILFAFIGTFTYVKRRAVREPLSAWPAGALVFVYFVFLPSVRYRRPLRGPRRPALRARGPGFGHTIGLRGPSHSPCFRRGNWLRCFFGPDS
jgi:hypothetical protein